MKKAEANPLAQAYLHKVNSHPGVYCIALNRPKSKNAISVQLLKVGISSALDTTLSLSLTLPGFARSVESGHIGKTVGLHLLYRASVISE